MRKHRNKSRMGALRISTCSCFAVVAAALPAHAIEPTPPIVFLDMAKYENYIPLAVDAGQVTDLELTAIILLDGEPIAEERLDYGQLEVRELDVFPTPDEQFHKREQEAHAAAESDTKLVPQRRLQRPIEPQLKLERLPQLRGDRATIIDKLRGGVDVRRLETAGQPGKALLFLIPSELENLKRQKDGYYAVSYLATATWANDPSSKRIESQIYGRYEVRSGTIRSLSLQEYSDLTDPPERVSDAAGREILIHAGRFGLEPVPLDKTDKSKALPVDIESGAEQPDSGEESGRAKEESERNER